MTTTQQETKQFNHGRYAYQKGWCRCDECIQGYENHKTKLKEWQKAQRQKKSHRKKLATISINPLLEWVTNNDRWSDVDRYKKRALLRNENKKISVYEIDKLCNIFQVHPIEVYGWDWISNPDITEGAEVVD